MTDIQKTIVDLKSELKQNTVSREPADTRQAKSIEIMARTLLLMLEHATSTDKSEEKKIGYILGAGRGTNVD